MGGASPDSGSPYEDDAAASVPVWGGLPVLRRGALESLAVRGAGALAAFGAHWALAQALPMAEYGAYLHVLGWIGLLALPCTLGFHLATVRLAAGYAADGQADLLRGLLPHAGRATLLVSGAVAALAALGGWAFDARAPYTLLAVAAGAAVLPFASAAAVAGGVAQGLRWIAAGRAPSALLRPALIGGVAYAFARGGASLSAAEGLLIALGGYAIAAGATWIVAVAATRRCAGGGAAATQPREWRRVALPLLGITVLEMLLGGLSVPVVALVLGEEPTAAFGVALRVSGVLLFLTFASNAIVAPVVAAAHAGGELAAQQSVIRTLVRVVFLLTVLAGAVLWLSAEPILALFGDGYVVGTVALRLLVTSTVVGAAFGPHGLLLAMTGHNRELTWTLGLAASLQLLGLLLVLTPYGISGAAAVSCVVTVVRGVPLLVTARRRLGVTVSIL